MNKLIGFLLSLIIISPCYANYLTDELVNTTITQVTKPETNTQYNYNSTEKIPIKLAFVDNLGTEKDVYEGETINLKLLKSVIWKDEIIAPKDSTITAKVGIIIPPGMNGIPASIILEDFKFNNISKKQITNSFELFGQDRSLFVFPLKWALTPLPPTGSLTNFIMGGHVKLKPSKVITLYYYPEWQ
jgi:hypothetical protein